MRGLGAYITLPNGKRRYAKLDQGSGAVASLTTVGVGGLATLDLFGNLNIPFIPVAGAGATSMPLASSLGIVSNGTDQTTALNAIFSNTAYVGVIMDFITGGVGGGAVTINGSVNAQGKTIGFVPGSYFKGTGRIFNHIHGSGYRQKCYDIGTSGVPALTVDPIGTTTSDLSIWAFGAKDDGSDISRAWQATVDCCIRNGGKICDVLIPCGTYTSNNPVFEYNWNGSFYAPHQVRTKGQTNFSEASGYGTVINYTRHDSFCYATQASKGGSFKNIKINGPFAVPTFSSNYALYNSAPSDWTDGVTRDSRYSPNACTVIDAFGPSVPPDGGYPGNDAYGNPLSGYYRGSSNGTTGYEFENIFRAGWIVCLITSPSGGTVNAELISDTYSQFSNYKTCVSGCQDQEKGNVVAFAQAWGTGYQCFSTNQYGAGSIGQWTLRDWNIAGLNVRFGTHNDSGYIPSCFENIFAESIGSIGFVKTTTGGTFINCRWNFASYSEAQSYTQSQVQTPGYTHIGGVIRMYGSFQPITIDASSQPCYFQDVGFEVVPFFTTGYARGNCSFKNCTVGDTAIIMNPDDLQTMLSSSYTDSIAYGNIRIKSGSTTYTFESSVPAMPLPINHVLANYTVTISVVGGIRQATISCPADELNRVFFGDVIVGASTAAGTQQAVGIVDLVNKTLGTFRINYIPAWVVSGNLYYLFVWLPLYNISFTGDETNGNNTITNVVIKDGSLTQLVTNKGLIYTKSINVNDSFNSNLIRIVSWNAGTATATFDKNASASVSKLLITNTDAKPSPGTPTFVAGAGAGTVPTISIIKGKDNSFQISVLTGSGTPTGVIVTVSFSIPFAGGYIPSIKFSPANANAAALSGATQVWMDAINTNSFTINSGSSALANATTYIWNIEAN